MACLVPEGRRVWSASGLSAEAKTDTVRRGILLVHMIYAGPQRLRVQLASQGSQLATLNVDDIGRMPVLAPPPGGASDNR